MYSISKQESSIKCIRKFVSLDENPLLRGWKLLEFKWGKTAFGESNYKSQEGLPYLIYFLTVFMFIKELAFIIN